MKIKTKTVQLHEVDYFDLDEAVTQFLKEKGYAPPGYQYLCVGEQEWSNDENHSMNVDGKIDKYALGEIKKGEFNYHLNAILNLMAKEGEIPKGEYKISICW